MTQITGKIYQQTNAAGTENRFPRTVMEAVLGLNSYLQDQFGSLADIYMPIEGISESKPNQEFVFRKTPNTIKAKALTLDKIKGKTLAWNQLVVNGNFEQGTEDWNVYFGTISADNSILTYTVTNPTDSSNIEQTNFPDIASHKYLFAAEFNYSAKPSYSGDGFWGIGGYYGLSWDIQSIVPNSWFRVVGIITSTGKSVNKEARLYLRTVGLSAGDTIQIRNLVSYDLTLMFGAGNEPSTVAEFEAMYPGYHAYNPGALISNNAESLETVGFNQWDEEARFGYFQGGKFFSDALFRICSKNFISVLPNTQYASNIEVLVYAYDERKIFIQQIANGGTHFTTPENAAYIQFSTIDGGHSTYNHDICINFSDPSRNGQYEPYKKSVCQLNLKTRTGKLNGQGASVVVFPDGMNGVGTSLDEANRIGGTKRMASVNLGDLDYSYFNESGHELMISTNLVGVIKNVADGNTFANARCSRLSISTDNRLYGHIDINAVAVDINGHIGIYIDNMGSDPISFKAAMQGVELVYELATPQEYVWDEPMPMSTNAGITESRISPNADGISAPMCCDITYGMGASDYATDAEYASYAGNAQYAEVAARLLTPRTIWGQVFDGSANITGAMTGVSAIDSLMYFDTSNGRIGIGISTPLYNLDVAGTFHAAGNVEIGGTLISRTNPSILHSIASYGEVEIDSETELTLNRFDIDEDGNAAFEMASVRDCLRLRYYSVDAHEFSDSDVSFDGDHVSFQNPLSAPRYDSSSDQRLKTNLSPVALTVEQIASAPAVEFNWVGNGQRGAGSIAQYWEEQLPYNVHHNGDMLTMEYGNIALISAIVCARKIQELEEQVKKLKEIINNKYKLS